MEETIKQLAQGHSWLKPELGSFCTSARCQSPGEFHCAILTPWTHIGAHCVGGWTLQCSGKCGRWASSEKGRARQVSVELELKRNGEHGLVQTLWWRGGHGWLNEAWVVDGWLVRGLWCKVTLNVQVVYLAGELFVSMVCSWSWMYNCASLFWRAICCLCQVP